MNASTGPHPLKGVDMPSWLIRYDEHGACTSVQTRAALLDRLHSAPPSDIVLFSHGWNTGLEDAASLYTQFLRQFEALLAAHPPSRRFDPLFVGVLWPSIWLSFEGGPGIASGGADAMGAAGSLIGELAERIAAAVGTAGLARVYALLAAPAINDADAAELARLIAPAFGVIADEGAAAQGRDTVAEDVLAMMHALEATQPGAHAAQPFDFDDFSRPVHAGDASDAGAAGSAGALPGQPRAAGASAWLDPRHALRLFSLYQMKDRAGAVGFNGVAALLRDLLAIAGAPGIGASTAAPARVHAVGHSFGCKVLLSAICAAPLPRPLASLLLMQPAVSHLCFADAVPDIAKPGGYRDALSADRVLAPIFSTYSRQDFPLHDTFHLALRRASDLGEAQIAGEPGSTSAGAPPSRYASLGGYGPRRAGQVLIDPLPPAGTPVALPKDGVPIVAFDGSQGLVQGHGDVTGPALAWLLRELMFR